MSLSSKPSPQPRRKPKRLLKFFLFLLAFLVVAELFLRFYYGFCDTVLMQADANYEYIAQPNQDRFRFRNHIRYNSESMRSPEVDTTALIILGLGDSILNGGAQTDNDSLATTILSDSLSNRYHRKVQFLNISAGSWAPDNLYAYLKKQGDFGAKGAVLFVSSHDAYDNMTFEPTVDVNVNFPSKQYTLALWELWDRYLQPRLPQWAQKSAPPLNPQQQLGINKRTPASVFNPGFDSLAIYSRQHHLPLTIYLHAESAELEAGHYNEQGRQIIQFAQVNGIPLIKDLENGLSATDFRDPIHINPAGQRKMATTVLRHFTDSSFVQ